MDPFWGITLSVLAVAKFWKREKARAKDKKYFLEKEKEKERNQKIAEVVDMFMLKHDIPETPKTREELEAEKAAKEAQKQRDKDIAELRKQGFTDELIATIIPTINNGG